MSSPRRLLRGILVIVKLLLTSGGITNASVRATLVDLLGKPIEESRALVIPTAQWGASDAFARERVAHGRGAVGQRGGSR